MDNIHAIWEAILWVMVTWLACGVLAQVIVACVEKYKNNYSPARIAERLMITVTGFFALCFALAIAIDEVVVPFVKKVLDYEF